MSVTFDPSVCSYLGSGTFHGSSLHLQNEESPEPAGARCRPSAITQRSLGLLLRFLATEASTLRCFWKETPTPTGGSTHRHFSLHPPPALSTVHRWEMLEDSWAGRPEVWKVSLQASKHRNKLALWWKMFVQLMSDYNQAEVKDSCVDMSRRPHCVSYLTARSPKCWWKMSEFSHYQRL